MEKERYIIHIDMDAFFAAIEQRDNPNLKNKPVIIGADPKKGKGRGVVSTCSYEARKFGVHSAMPISTAFRICPKGIFLPVDGKKYRMVSRQIYGILYDFTPEIEIISVDEAFMDITGSYHLFGTPLDVCGLIKRKIKNETGLTASIGLAPIKMAAKIASDLKKPDGLVEVKAGKLLDFLWPLDIGKLWGLGGKTKAILNNLGIFTIGDIAKKDIKEFSDIFGKSGAHLWRLANGIDERAIECGGGVKSFSNEHTFDEDTDNADEIRSVLMYLSEKVAERMRGDKYNGRTITLKIRLQGFSTFTRAKTLPRHTNTAKEIYKSIKILYENFDRRGKSVRLVGVKVSALSPEGKNEDLFENQGREKDEKIQLAMDKIKQKFGRESIHYGEAFNALFLP